MLRGRRKTTLQIQEWLKENLPRITLLPNQTYTNNKTVLSFSCIEHGEFETTWNQVTRGSHCPQCGKERLVTKTNNRRTSFEEVLRRIQAVHGGSINVLSPEKYEHQHSRLDFQCSRGHLWNVKVYNVIQGRGCPKCAGKNITTEEFKSTLLQVHNGKIHLMDGQEYTRRHSTLFFKCDVVTHPPFKAAPNNIIYNKSGCPECKKDKLRSAFALSTKDVYQRIHSHFSDFFPLPNQVYVNQDTIWKFSCKVESHPIWESRVSNYYSGNIKYGCALCAGERPLNSSADLKELILELFQGNIELISSFPKRVNKRDTVLEFFCKEHNIKFKTKIALLQKSKGCELCSLESRSSKRRTSVEDLIEQVKLIHRDFITVEDASNYLNTESKIKFRCLKKPKHGVFEASAHGILGGNGCPICKMSRGERKIWFWLKDNEIDFQSQKRVKKHVGNGVFIFDFYLPSKKVIIEYDGRQHTIPVERWGGKKALKKTQINDSLKDEYARLIGFEMMRIPYTDFESIDDLLNSKFGL